MAIDVFVSCSASDKDVAETLILALGDCGISCWSPVVVKAGQPVKAPDTFRMVVLVFSAKANISKRVNSEIQYAIDRDMPIVALSVEDVASGRTFKRLARTKYWLRGSRTSLPGNLKGLAYRVAMLLARLDMSFEAHTHTGTGQDPGGQEMGPHPEPGPGRQRSSDRRLERAQVGGRTTIGSMIR